MFDPTNNTGNGTKSWTTDGTSKVTSVSLPAGTYEVFIGSPSIGPIVEASSTVITAGETATFTANATQSVDLVTLSGTVVDSDTNAVEGVVVWAARANGPGHYMDETDSSGDYSIKVPDGRDYFVGVDDLVYVAQEGDILVKVDGNTVQDFVLSEASTTISGEVTSNGSAVNCVWIEAEKMVDSDTNVWKGAPTDDGGNYELRVDDGTWTLHVRGPQDFYQYVGVADSGTENIALENFPGCVFREPKMQSITDTSGGQVATDKVRMDVPANAAGTSQSSVSFAITEVDDAYG